jgi:methylmalonyl-CoA/ethylmalonyl-CoA epimerase
MAMAFGLQRIGQIALGVQDVDRAEAFYRDTLGLRKLYRFDELAFFDCSGVRLLLEKVRDGDPLRPAAPVYFACPDLALAMRELQKRGVSFVGPAQLVAAMEDHDLWMAYFTDPDGNALSLMQEAPKGYVPPGASAAAPKA